MTENSSGKKTASGRNDLWKHDAEYIRYVELWK